MARDYHQVLSSLLKKAESTDSTEEAEAILEKVADLMTKHSITEAELHAAREARGELTKADEIVKVTITYEGQYAQGLEAWSNTIALCFGCRVQVDYRNPKSRTRKITYLYGYRPDVEQVQQLIDSLRVQMIRPLKQFQTEQRDKWYPTTVAAFIERRSFVQGYVHGAADLLRVKRQQLAPSGSSTALVLRDRSKEVQAYTDQFKYTGSDYRPRGINASRDGYARGAAAGREADVSTRSRSTTPRIGA